MRENHILQLRGKEACGGTASEEHNIIELCKACWGMGSKPYRKLETQATI